ncbi:19412_t:CDS:2 [Dentiscutata erythropus]|uniref:19412_t:CDS:1 n=1 Tax=Dentiscutata erythropus TaxID=1348616 RepID=A0A9N9HFT0_9GLOM|nr:19412_t:CDS:2 [Dentiscutata erythropus]
MSMLYFTDSAVRLATADLPIIWARLCVNIHTEKQTGNVAPISKKRALDNITSHNSSNIPVSPKIKVADDVLIGTAYNSLVVGNIIPFIKLLKATLLTRSRMSLSSANEAVLQAIVEILLPSSHRVPELCLVMDGKKQKGSGRFGFPDIFVLGGTEGNDVCLELKYISLIGLVRDANGNQVRSFGANELEKLDKILETEDEESLLNRRYVYWSKDLGKMVQTTIRGIINDGLKQLRSYMSMIAKGHAVGYSTSGVIDERIKTIKSGPNKLKGFISWLLDFVVSCGDPLKKQCLIINILKFNKELHFCEPV